MSADESLGSHQLNSCAALLEENLQTSSETSKIQNPQLKKMADGKRPQKGGKRKEEHIAFEIPDELYVGYCTPDEEIHGKETEKQRKTRMQRIKRRWAYEWRSYRYVTPKYIKDFAIKPPCKRPPLAPGQTADPTSMRRGEEFPKEWEKYQAKLRKQAQKAVEEFNRASKTSQDAGAGSSASAPKKSMKKKPAQKPKPSTDAPSRPKYLAPKSSAMSLEPKLSSSKATEPKAQAAPTSSAPPPSISSSRAAARASTPVVLPSCQRTAGFQTATIDASSASASGHISSNTPKLKKKVTAGQGTRPSPKSKVVVPQANGQGMDDEDELAKFVQRRMEEAARAKNTSVPTILSPKKILDFIDIWCSKPDTPLDDLDLPPGPSHLLSAFDLNEKHKIEKAKLVRKEMKKKQKELKDKMLTISPEQLVAMQSEIQCLSDEYDRQAEHCCGVKDRFITASNKVVDDHNQREAAKFGQAPPTSSSAPPQEPVRATVSVALEENISAAASTAPEENTRATATVASEEIIPPSSLAAVPEQSSTLKLITLPSASEVKNTSTAVKRKASAPSAAETVKKLKVTPMSSTAPIDAIPISSAPPTRSTQEL